MVKEVTVTIITVDLLPKGTFSNGRTILYLLYCQQKSTGIGIYFAWANVEKLKSLPQC